MSKFASIGLSKIQRDRLALEMIGFQNDSFASNIEIELSTLMQDMKRSFMGSKKLHEHDSVRYIQEATFKRTGVKVKLVLDQEIGATIPFYPNENSAIVDSFLRGNMYSGDWRDMFPQQLKLLDSAREHKGEVDIEKCKVTGIFSLYENPIYINIALCNQFGLTPGQVTAMYLHELGHCFTAFEYSNRINDTNQILAQLAKDSFEQKGGNREYIFRELKVLNPAATDEQLEHMLSGQNIVLGYQTMIYLKDMVKNQMPTSWYTESQNETLADNFTARWGYGTDLVIALEKLHGALGPELYGTAGAIFGTIQFFCGITCQIILFMMLLVSSANALIAGAVLGILAGIGFGLLACFIALLMFITIISQGSYASPMTYDDLKYRYKRIRNQLVERIKTIELPDTETRQVIRDIKVLDKVLEGKDKYRTLIGVILDFFNPKHSARQSDMRMQRLLEELSANGLYIQAAALRTA